MRLGLVFWTTLIAATMAAPAQGQSLHLGVIRDATLIFSGEVVDVRNDPAIFCWPSLEVVFRPTRTFAGVIEESLFVLPVTVNGGAGRTGTIDWSYDAEVFVPGDTLFIFCKDWLLTQSIESQCLWKRYYEHEHEWRLSGQGRLQSVLPYSEHTAEVLAACIAAEKK